MNSLPLSKLSTSCHVAATNSELAGLFRTMASAIHYAITKLVGGMVSVQMRRQRHCVRLATVSSHKTVALAVPRT